MTVDLAKLNRAGCSGTFGSNRSNTGVSAQATRNLANSSAATRKSIFSNYRQPNFVAGQNVAKGLNRYNFQGARAQRNAPFIPRHTNYSTSANHIVSRFEMPKQNGIDNFMQTAMKFNMIGQTVAGTVGVLGGLVGSSSIKSLGEGISSLAGNSSAALNTLAGQLSSASSLIDVNNIEMNINDAISNMNSNYQTIGASAQNKISESLSTEGVSEGLQTAGIDANDIRLPQLTNPLDMTDLAGAEESINTDIGTIQAHANKLNTNIGNIGSKRASVSQEKSSNQITISQLEAAISQNPSDEGLKTKLQQAQEKQRELEKQFENLQKAEDALKNIQQECASVVDDLKTKQSEIKDLKNTKEQLEQKKFNIAKSQAKELDGLMRKIDKLKTKDSEKNRAELAALKQQVGKIVQSFTAVGTNPITNPKGGETINPAEILNKANEYMT